MLENLQNLSDLLTMKFKIFVGKIFARKIRKIKKIKKVSFYRPISSFFGAKRSLI